MKHLEKIMTKAAGHKIVDAYGDDIYSDRLVIHLDNGTHIGFGHDGDGCIDSVSGLISDLSGHILHSIERGLNLLSDNYEIDDENDDYLIADVFKINTDAASIVIVWCAPKEDIGKLKISYNIDSKNHERFDRIVLEQRCWYCDYEAARIYSAKACDKYKYSTHFEHGTRFLINFGKVTLDFIHYVGYENFTILCTDKEAEHYKNNGWETEKRNDGLTSIWKVTDGAQ